MEWELKSLEPCKMQMRKLKRMVVHGVKGGGAQVTSLCLLHSCGQRMGITKLAELASDFLLSRFPVDFNEFLMPTCHLKQVQNNALVLMYVAFSKHMLP